MLKEKETLQVEGMSCSHCENAIKKGVSALKGIENVTVDLKGKTVTVEYEPIGINLATIKETINGLGYDVV
jgi:copper chaperone